MYTSKYTLKISDLRKHTAEVLDEINEQTQPVVIFSRSEPKAVIMNFEIYQQMKERRSSTEDNIDDEPKGVDFFINTPDKYLIKTKGLDAVKIIRELRGYND